MYLNCIYLIAQKVLAKPGSESSRFVSKSESEATESAFPSLWKKFQFRSLHWTFNFKKEGLKTELWLVYSFVRSRSSCWYFVLVHLIFAQSLAQKFYLNLNNLNLLQLPFKILYLFLARASVRCNHGHRSATIPAAGRALTKDSPLSMRKKNAKTELIATSRLKATTRRQKTRQKERLRKLNGF